MLTLIENVQLYDPAPCGVRQILLGGGKVLAIDESIDVSGSALRRLDAQNALLLPGFVDALTHPCGGGGEGGYGNRTAEVEAAEFIRAGVTTPVGALGTDSIARQLEVLFGKTMELRARGLHAFMYTGAYRVPAPTLTGDVAKDIALLEPVIGVGEVAISDHRSAQPSAGELRRLAADTALGGTLRGEGGRVMLHLGDGDSRLRPMYEALEGSELPLDTFYPTHINRSEALLQDGARFAAAGGFVDITASTTPELVAAGDIPALEALRRLISAGAPAAQISISSDAGGSLPLYRDGRLCGLTAASPRVMLETLQQGMRDPSEPLPHIIAALTRNPARALRLPDAGEIRVGAPANFLVIDPQSLELEAVYCGAHWRMRDGEVLETPLS